MDEDKASDTGYDTSDGEWLSYAELAARRGIDRQSAFKLAARHHWRRQKGNTGQVRVFVPSAFAEPEDKSSDAGYDMQAALAALREQHEHERADLRSLVRQLHIDRDRERQRADAADARADTALAVADRTLAEFTEIGSRANRLERDLAAALTVADQARAAAQEALEAADALRQADAARQARGLVARFRAAWRGE